MSKARLNALSDGVFAILLTILILEFKPVNIHPGGLLPLMLKQGPLFAMYVMSYVYVGTSWLFHHDYFIYVKKTNRTLNILNLFLLFTVTLVNYAMVLIIEALTNGNHLDIQIGIIVYDLVAMLISFSFLILYRYLEHHPELQNFTGIKDHYSRIRSDPARSVTIYGASIIASFFSNILAGILLIGGVIFHFVAYLRYSQVIKIGVKKNSVK
ncbi:TMEM175 family protein [Lacticaseibacillus zhaodongensis]|uniref:TMEM175 family protein n=1 Tax=Lacticaseibacillus zhaodongensis TaxID=2668065 RepID=UPI0012D2F437|nr:TMEM175 family protein [Lacticaseibacillus zhaodongensis]